MVPIYSLLLFGGALAVLHDRGLLKVPFASLLAPPPLGRAGGGGGGGRISTFHFPFHAFQPLVALHAFPSLHTSPVVLSCHTPVFKVDVKTTNASNACARPQLRGGIGRWTTGQSSGLRPGWACWSGRCGAASHRCWLARSRTPALTCPGTPLLLRCISCCPQTASDCATAIASTPLPELPFEFCWEIWARAAKIAQYCSGIRRPANWIETQSCPRNVAGAHTAHAMQVPWDCERQDIMPVTHSRSHSRLAANLLELL